MSDFLPFDEQLNILLELSINPKTGRPYTLAEINENTGIAAPTLSQMRSGKIKNPQLSSLRDLCKHFGISMDYFTTKTRDECYAMITGGSQSAADTHNIEAVGELSFRARNLSEKSKADLYILLDWVKKLEGLRKMEIDVPHLSNNHEEEA